MFVELRIVEEIPASTRVADVITPAAGKKVFIRKFHGSAAFSKNAFVGIAWKYEHASESEVWIWQTKGVDTMPKDFEIAGSEVDGVRKLAVVCDNAESGDLMLGCWAEIEIED